MSKEKQIEELTNELVFTSNYGTYNAVANYLVNKGFRKQSEGEWYVNYMMSKKPSKRGRIIQYTTYTCSVCGKPNGRKKSKFCPNCGAKMKGGEQG